MKNELEIYKEKTFEDIKHIDEVGNEYWEARELMIALEYSKWEHFAKVINKAKISCNLSGMNVEEHFPIKGKTIAMPKGASKEVIDYKLSRYACYLIVQNANPARHQSVALGQTYFAVQTRKMEITEEEYNKLSEDEKRLYTRINIKKKTKIRFCLIQLKMSVFRIMGNLMIMVIWGYMAVKRRKILLKGKALIQIIKKF